MDDIRTLTETVLFKNDINLLLVKSDEYKTYEKQLYDEKNTEVKDIRIRKQLDCKKHYKEVKKDKNFDTNLITKICYHEYVYMNGKHIEKPETDFNILLSNKKLNKTVFQKLISERIKNYD
jgi:hypothetical protein